MSWRDGVLDAAFEAHAEFGGGFPFDVVILAGIKMGLCQFLKMTKRAFHANFIGICSN
jgi:hypothetical protein